MRWRGCSHPFGLLATRFQIALARGLLDDGFAAWPGRAGLPSLRNAAAMPDRRPPRDPDERPEIDPCVGKWLAPRLNSGRSNEMPAGKSAASTCPRRRRII